MRFMTLAVPALILAAGCERTESLVAPQVPAPPEAPGGMSAKGGGKPQWIAFESERTGVVQIYRAKSEGGGLEQLTFSGESRYPSWSPGGKRLAFTSYRDQPAGEIYVMNGDGRNQTRITNSASADYHPDWAPDGRRILFVSDRTGSLDIHSMNSDGSDVELEVNWPASQETRPRWSPDQQYFAMLSDFTTPGIYNIWIVSATSGVKQLTFPGIELQSLAWSSDSRRVLFYYNVGGGIQYLYSVDIETTQTTVVASNSSLNAPFLYSGTAMSPAGDRIAYIGQTVGMSFLATARLDGSDRKVLSQAPGMHGGPVWAR